MITKIEVDLKDISSLSKTITQLQKIRKAILEEKGCKPLTFAASNYNAEHIIPYLEIMYSMRSDYLITGSTNADYYVYAHCDPRKPLNIKTNLKHLFLASKFGLKYEPFYVGKGIRNRAYDLTRSDSHRKIRTLIRKDNKEVVIAILENNLIESDALHREAALIDILGLHSRLSSGFLVNLDEGLSADRYNAYSKLLEWDNIKKILKINKIKYDDKKNVNVASTTSKTDTSNLNSNLQKLQSVYAKYPNASTGFIIDKAKL